MDIKGVSEHLRAFAQERDWEKFHTPRNLSASISVEAAELLEHFQWSRGQSWSEITGDQVLREKVGEELADIFLYLVRFADLGGIDLLSVAERKLALNAEKYPVEKSKGSDKKYTEF